jgi:hypothetical protein
MISKSTGLGNSEMTFGDRISESLVVSASTFPFTSTVFACRDPEDPPSVLSHQGWSSSRTKSGPMSKPVSSCIWSLCFGLSTNFPRYITTRSLVASLGVSRGETDFCSQPNKSIAFRLDPYTVSVTGHTQTLRTSPANRKYQNKNKEV